MVDYLVDGRPTVLVDGITFHPESVGKMEWNPPGPVVIGCGLAVPLWLARRFSPYQIVGNFFLDLWTGRMCRG